MRHNKVLAIIILFLCTICLFGCDSSNLENKGILVTFELNGGIFKNCTEPIKQYYEYEKDAKKLIFDPQSLAKDTIQKANYTFKGWYKDAECTIAWDFAKDTIGDEGLTLYAKWEKDIKFTYNVCYIDETSNTVKTLGVYEVEPGDVFNDKRGYANKRSGYTALGFVDEYNNPWDFTKVHPGGDTDVAINVYVKYMVGEYALVSTKEEFMNAVDNGDNIYLLNNIDLENETIDFGDFEKREFQGRGFTVSNFKIVKTVEFPQHLVEDHTDSGKNSVYVSMFGDIDESIIKDVTFDNVQFEIKILPSRTYKIYFDVLSRSIKDSNVSNVTINYTYECISLPNEFDESNFVITKIGYIVSEENSVLENLILNLNKGE